MHNWRAGVNFPLVAAWLLRLPEVVKSGGLAMIVTAPKCGVDAVTAVFDHRFD